ncbi:hypothetical protein Tco_0694596, partial [Tanacetum coccineum]
QLTVVWVMALPVQNINYSAFRSMFEREKLSGNNFNGLAGAEPNIVAQWTALYDAHTEIACLMLGSMTPELHRQFELHYRMYDSELRSSPKTLSLTAKETPAKDDAWPHCKEGRNIDRNCPVYLDVVPERSGSKVRLCSSWRFIVKKNSGEGGRDLEERNSRRRKIQHHLLLEFHCNIPKEEEGFETTTEGKSGGHSLGILNEPTSYKAAMLDSESNKWIDAINAEIQSMMDNMDLMLRLRKKSDKPISTGNPRLNLHWTAVYSQGGYHSTELRVECYCDAGIRRSDRDDTKSRRDIVFVPEWRRSGIWRESQAEYHTMAWYCTSDNMNLLNMFCDNSAAVHYANEGSSERRQKETIKDYIHYVRECG